MLDTPTALARINTLYPRLIMARGETHTSVQKRRGLVSGESEINTVSSPGREIMEEGGEMNCETAEALKIIWNLSQTAIRREVISSW